MNAMNAMNTLDINHTLALLINNLSLKQIKHLVEDCGATALTEAACATNDYDKIVYLCEHGANDYKKIYRSYDHNLNTTVYLLNKVNIVRSSTSPPRRYMPVFLKAGAGRLLEYYPELLKDPEAKPYIKRRDDITAIIEQYLIHNLTQCILDYLSYEIPKLSDMKMILLEIEYLNT